MTEIDGRKTCRIEHFVDNHVVSRTSATSDMEPPYFATSNQMGMKPFPPFPLVEKNHWRHPYQTWALQSEAAHLRRGVLPFDGGQRLKRGRAATEAEPI